MSSVAPAWSPPAEFEEFRLVRYLGGGGMGQVWLAHDLLLDRPVAVKFIGGGEPDAAATERVLAEARAAARLQHPNVAAVHRVGQLGRRPYIISEYVRGESLDRLPKPLPTARAVELAVQLCRGLGAAHRRGVLHRDLKPGNAILADGGEVKLVDFGLAQLFGAAPLPAFAAPSPRPSLPGVEATGATLEAARPNGAILAFERRTASVGGVAGTPYYMAPETWRGEAATPRSDLYSLGALLFELCSGRTPFADTPIHELPDAVGGRAARSLATVAPAVDARVAALVDRCLATDAANRPSSADELLESLLGLTDGAPAASARPDGNPYRGLMPFEAEHRALFFGRGREIRAVVERLRAERLLVVTGDSGAGKSSLCRAGVLPLAVDGTLRDGRRWSAVTLVPGRRPLRALAAALAPLVDADEDELERLAGDEPDVLARRVVKLLGRDRGLLVFVDQLEELATESAAAEAERFGAAVRALVDAGGALRLLAALRGDFVTRVATAASLGELLSRALYILSPLDEAATREAIVGPARLTGVAFESQALVDELVRATVAADGGQPLLQFALAELWEARDRGRGLITRAALEAIGGVDGALERHGDRVLATLLPDGRAAARRLLLRLTSADGTRARRSGAELGSDAAAMSALEALVRGRLVVARQGDDGAAYEVAHEALLRGWATLRGWLAAEAGDRAARLRLESAAAEWERLGRAREALWSSRQLAEAAALDTGSLDARERAFVLESTRALRRQRWRRSAVAVGVPLLLGAAIGGVQLGARHRVASDIAARLADVDADEARARAASDEAHRRAAAAFAAFDRADHDAAELTWQRARAAAAAAELAYGRAAEGLEAALSLDGRRADVRRRFADVLLARAIVADEQHHSSEADELLARVRLYDSDGTRAARYFAPGRLTLATTPPATGTLTTWSRGGDGHRHAGDERPLGTTPLITALAPGSYVVTLTAPGRATVRWPLVLARGETLSTSLTLPPAAAVPDGFVYVPPGRFLFGTAVDEMRTFDASAPLHARTTGGYLIARHETTFGEWLDFLAALPPSERRRHIPRGAGNLHGAVRLDAVDGGWRLVLKPSEHTYAARAGEPIVYRGRTRLAAQDWRQFPVVGIDWTDVEAYTAWLRSSGRVRGARPCREDEWERAARGADDREFPHGDTLAPDDANFDETYGKNPLAFGPDAVGAHPASRSPFGLDDASGNVWEWTRPLNDDGDARVLRGGAYYYATSTNRIPNRQVVERGMRDSTLGVRICAEAP